MSNAALELISLFLFFKNFKNMTTKIIMILGHAFYGIFLKHCVSYHHACRHSLDKKKKKTTDKTPQNKEQI